MPKARAKCDPELTERFKVWYESQKTDYVSLRGKLMLRVSPSGWHGRPPSPPCGEVILLPPDLPKHPLHSPSPTNPCHQALN
jgi:hypothetical protein